MHRMTTEEIGLDEAWETTSGLMDDYEGTVTRSYFSTDARYNDGKTMLMIWEIQTTNPEVPETIEKFPLGSGWDSKDGGETVVHEKGNQKFNKSSIYGKIVKQTTEPTGSLHDAFPAVKAKGRPTQASVWNGLSFHFKEQTTNYGGDIGEKSRVVPVKFLGEGAQASLPNTPAAASTAAAPAATNTDVDPVVKARLTQAAKAAGSFAEFVDAAISVEGVATNDALMAQVTDDGAQGFYAQATAA